MAKTHKFVNRQRLVEAIASVETNGPLSNRQTLYGAAAESYNVACGAKGLEYITPSIVLLRIKEWNLTVKTPLGKRGRPKGFSPRLDPNGQPLPRKARSKRTASKVNIDAMRAGEFKGSQFDGLIAKIENGSLTARIKANCLACTGFVREEVKHCQCTNCPLWDVRPYRDGVREEASAAETVEEEPVEEQLAPVETQGAPSYPLLPILA